MKFSLSAIVLGPREKTWHVIREKSSKLSNRKGNMKVEVNQKLTMKLFTLIKFVLKTK